MADIREQTPAAFSLKPWKKLIPVTKKAWPAFFLSVVANTLLAGIDFYLPLLQSRVVDDYITAGTLSGFGGYIAWYALIGFVQLALIILYFKGCMQCEAYSCRDLRDSCFVNLQKLSLDYHNVTSAGHNLSRVMSDTSRIAEMMAWTISDTIWGFAYIIGVFVVMARLNFRLAITLLVITPIVAGLTFYFQKKLIVLNRQVRAEHSKITAGYNEGIMGAKTSKTLALEDKLCAEFEEITSRASRAGILHARMRAIYVPLIVLCGTLAASVTLYRGGHMV